MVYNAKMKTLLLAFAATVPILMSSPGVAQLCGPVQRYASVRSDLVNVRTGPGKNYPFEWVFLLENMPVAVIAEYEHWRRICDWEGVTGWVHRAMLSPKRTLIVSSPIATLRRKPLDNAPAVARLETRVICKLLDCKEHWCRVSVEGYRGWLAAEDFWGIEPMRSAENNTTPLM